MQQPVFPYRIFPLGDSAITVDFGNCIDGHINTALITRFEQWKHHPLAGMTEAVPAYSSISVYFDLPAVKKLAGNLTAYEWMKQQAKERLEEPLIETELKRRLIRIPVCYNDEFAPDLERLAAAKGISRDEVIALHTANTYRVFMMGFLPGFAYMGEVDEKITAPRKPQPVSITAGSVGIAGKQTGIYPFASPGGWQIIGRTALTMFDTEKEEPALLQAGDQVQFYSITKNEFSAIQNSSVS